MPQAAAYTLSWSVVHLAYELRAASGAVVLRMQHEEPAWFAWLAQGTPFAFVGKTASCRCLLRQEAKQRGESYWYAYHRSGKTLRKKYVGKAAAITFTRLEEAAHLLSADRSGCSPLQERPALQEMNAPHALPSVSLGTLADPEGSAARHSPSPAPDAPPHDSLLATRLSVPHPRKPVLHRPRLTARLQQAREEGAVTLLSAPAGYGKTTLLTDWLAESGTRVAWLTLVPEENEPSRFLSSVIAALQTVCPGVGAAVLPWLRSPQAVPLPPCLAALTQELLSQEGEQAVVLDDYQVITNAALHHLITDLAEQLPLHLHLLIATRTDPPLPLARLRAQGRLVELRAADLRFDTTEIGLVVQAALGEVLHPSDLSELESRTEGWAAGVHLAALALRDQRDPSLFVRTFTGSHRFVFDYLSSEVLAHLPARVLSFLVQTSILEHLCGPLCEAVTGQQHGQETLELIERANLFVSPLDDVQQWYRYHPLFADVLRRRLGKTLPAQIPVLHRRASQWYEQQGGIVEAIRHALLSQDKERVAALLKTHGLRLLMQRGEPSMVLAWLDALPLAQLQADPELCILQAFVLVFTNRLEEAQARLSLAEQALQTSVPARLSHFVRVNAALLRCTMALQSGDLARSVALAAHARDLIPPGRPERAVPGAFLACEYLVSGDVTPAMEQQNTQVIAPVRALGNQILALVDLTWLARLQVLQGRLHRAMATYHEIEELFPRPPKQPAVIGSPSYYFGVGDVLREWNRLEDAERHLLQGMEWARGTMMDAETLTLGYTALARVYTAQGRHDEAARLLDDFAHLAQLRAFVPHLLARIRAERAGVERVGGDLQAALGWAETVDLPRGVGHALAFATTEEHARFRRDELCYPDESTFLVLAEVRIAQYRVDPAHTSLDELFLFLERMLADAEEKLRWHSVLEILVLQALAASTRGKRAQAIVTLKRALRLAEPEGYIRVFADRGAAMSTLLRQVQREGMLSDYVSRLLAACDAGRGAHAQPPASGHTPLVEPLTAREREVLWLLMEGTSNRQIAQRLVLSLSTVKKYLYTIYGKLGVENRIQAVNRARALKLWENLPPPGAIIP
jgi:LuxR family transcriptional regulator, maltose regulon positive regulatory protein